jgi:hypothetical protein
MRPALKKRGMGAAVTLRLYRTGTRNTVDFTYFGKTISEAMKYASKGAKELSDAHKKHGY